MFHLVDGFRSQTFHTLLHRTTYNTSLLNVFYFHTRYAFVRSFARRRCGCRRVYAVRACERAHSFTSQSSINRFIAWVLSALYLFFFFFFIVFFIAGSRSVSLPLFRNCYMRAFTAALRYRIVRTTSWSRYRLGTSEWCVVWCLRFLHATAIRYCVVVVDVFVAVTTGFGWPSQSIFKFKMTHRLPPSPLTVSSRSYLFVFSKITDIYAANDRV